AFRHYNPEEKVAGKAMKDWLRIAVCWWHTIRGTGTDPFGPGCHDRPWPLLDLSMQAHRDRAEAMFEFTSKLGAPFYCFHDRDVAPEGASLQESHDNLEEIGRHLSRLQKQTGIRL